MGTCPGCTNLGMSRFDVCGDADPLWGCVGAVLTGAFGTRLTGVDSVWADGNPTVFHSGITSSTPIASASSPNEVRVVQLRRERWAHDDSSRLSPNILSPDNRASIPCATMVSSEREICLQVWTPPGLPSEAVAQIKTAAFSRGRLELSGHRRCPVNVVISELRSWASPVLALPCQLASRAPTWFQPQVRARLTARCRYRPQPW